MPLPPGVFRKVDAYAMVGISVDAYAMVGISTPSELQRLESIRSDKICIAGGGGRESTLIQRLECALLDKEA